MELVCLDANALRDLSADPIQLEGYSRSKRESIKLCEKTLEWLVELDKVRVLAPFPAYLEYLDHIRENRLLRTLMDVEGLAPGDAFYNRKKHHHLSVAELESSVRHADNYLRHSSAFIESPRMQLEELSQRFDWSLFELLQRQSGLWIMDSFVFAAASSLGVDYYLTSDSDFSQQFRSRLGGIVKKVPMFINQREMKAREFPANKAPSELVAKRYPSKISVRHALVESVFEEEYSTASGKCLGGILEFRLQAIKGSSRGRHQTLLWYFHNSSQLSVEEGSRVTVIGQYFVKHLRVKEIRVGKEAVSSVIASENTPEVMTSLRVEFDEATQADPCLKQDLRNADEELRDNSRSFSSLRCDGLLCGE
ncbi:MAG: hypothetical protein JSU63_22165 [Phycisphaerales bacterium]|nr:MAG: hypothetical protein JSU63_22165 [Phycisphaerales bacterium]